MISKEAMEFRSQCPISSTLDIIGDRWSILIIRDLLFGACKYKDFLNSPEKIPTNILAQRLKLLESMGIIKKVLYQTRPDRFEYSLTDLGSELRMVLRSLREWGMAHIDERSIDIAPKRN